MIISRTPFRISFFGGGTDYPVWYKQKGGMVISTSINKYCYITTRYLPPFFKYKYRIRYTKRELTRTLKSIQHPSVRECLKFLDIKDGIEMVHASDLPAMSGLGSSSSFTVGFLNTLYSLLDKKTTKKKLAEEAIFVEQELIKENVGSQDQVIAAFGGFNKTVFNKDGSFTTSPINIEKDKFNELENNLLLYFTGFQRRASDIAVELIKNTPNKTKELDEMFKLAIEAFSILKSKKKSIDDFGKLLDNHWQLKRSLASSISNKFIDDIYKEATDAGALGGKILGAGGGGFMLFYVKPEDKERVKKRLKKMLYVPFKFENTGTQIVHKAPSTIENGYKG